MNINIGGVAADSERACESELRRLVRLLDVGGRRQLFALVKLADERDKEQRAAI